VEIRADIELGGSEQLFSLMVGRDLQRDAGQEPQICLTLPILRGLDGVRRMGKSLGNYIGISESPFDMMKKFMQVPDAVMRMYFDLLTDIPLAEIDSLLAGHPKTAKTTLARAVIGQYHSATEADAAANRWQQEVGEGALPTDIPTVNLSRSNLTDGKAQAARLLVEAGLTPSTSDARRAIAQGGAYFGEGKTRIETHDQLISVETGLLLFVGKKKFCRVELTD